MKDVKDWITVKKLYESGTPIRKIARDLKISRNTVRRLIKFEEEPSYKKRNYNSKIDQYEAYINIWYFEKDYRFNGTRIFRELKKLGYDGSISPVYRYLKKIEQVRGKISSKATKRTETPLGDQAQFDWSEYTMKIAEEKQVIYCFAMILSASRKKAMIFSKSCDGEAIYEAIHELFKELGGVTKELLIDNPKALVLENSHNKEVKFNLSALRLAAYLGFELNACNPYRARTKGKVEKPFQYIEEQFVKGSFFESMTALNTKGREFINEWSSMKHGTTKRVPNEHFLEEQHHLKPVKDKNFIINKLKERKVSYDSYISVNTNKYSVPVEYVDKKVKFRIVLGYKLEIFNSNLNIIATHEVFKNKDNICTIDEHYGVLNNIAPKSIPEIRRQFEATFKSGKDFYELAIQHEFQASFHARQILKLKELYTVDSLDLIVDYCLSNKIFNIEKVKEVLKNNYMDIVCGNNKNPHNIKEEMGLTRDLSYYEEGQN